ncbi:MAG: DUF695 domain-containing protein [Chitinophagaceae bacterium]|nr:DUF695 domain-containing protein [Chitinophagaceae bacterium]
MTGIKTLLALILCGFTCLAVQAQENSHWETYVMEMDKRPVSVMVDLAYGSSAEAKTKTNVIIVSLLLFTENNKGMPSYAEAKKLDTIENKLVLALAENLNASYAGRYTQNGKRDYFFYTGDTLKYRQYILSSIGAYALGRWNTMAKPDGKMDNYFTVLYPSQREMQRIYNRHMLDRLAEAGDHSTAPRKIDHFIFFKDEQDRKKFVRIVQDNGFLIENGGEEKGIKDRPYSLQISRVDKTDGASIDKVSLYVWELSLQYGGRYDGWETFAVK